MLTIQSAGSEGDDDGSSHLHLQPGYRSGSANRDGPSTSSSRGMNLSPGEYSQSRRPSAKSHEDHATAQGRPVIGSGHGAQGGDRRPGEGIDETAAVGDET